MLVRCVSLAQIEVSSTEVVLDPLFLVPPHTTSVFKAQARVYTPRKLLGAGKFERALVLHVRREVPL